MDIIKRIDELCMERAWTYYRLAKEAKIPYSTLSTMLRKTNAPSIPSLEKITAGLGITLADFFEDKQTLASHTQKKSEIQQLWESLDGHGQMLAKAYMEGLRDYCKTKKSGAPKLPHP